MKLAVPISAFAQDIYQENDDVTLIKADDDRCAKLLASREVSAALITPMAFAQLADSSSLRVIPAACVAPEDFTAASTIYFKGGSESNLTVGANHPDSYLTTLSGILLGELYGLEMKIRQCKSPSKAHILAEHDIAILEYEQTPTPDALDLSEEWLQLYKTPMPLYFWACWADSQDPEIDKSIKSITPESLPAFKEVQMGDEEMRKGRIHFLWHEKIEKAIDHCLEILFYHQYSKEIHSITLFDTKESKPGNEEIKPENEGPSLGNFLPN